MTTFRRIHRGDVDAHLRADTGMRLVEALPERHYRQAHLPGAIRLNHDEVRSRAEQLLPDKAAFIVVYCASTTCRNSRLLAQALAGMGYSNVAEYEEGNHK